MLGATLSGLYQGEMDVYATGTHDFAGNPAGNYLVFDLLKDSYGELLEWAQPDLIIHSAALTNVDYCERNPDQAFAVNTESVRKFLRAGPTTRLIYISSDAVFADGRHLATERDETNPANVYGKSKALAEQYLAAAGKNHCSIRTTIVGRNINPKKQGFVEWIVNSAGNGKTVSLFGDVLFTPISIWDFAAELKWVVDSNLSGCIHISGREAASKYEFGLALCKKIGLDDSLIARIGLDDMAFLAKRQKDQTLSSAHYESISHRRLPDIQETVDKVANHFKDMHYARI